MYIYKYTHTYIHIHIHTCVYCMSIMDLGRSTTDMEWFHGKIFGKYHIYAFVSSESPVKVLQICSSFTGNSYESTTDV